MTIGLDIAKHVFQVHAVDAAGAIVIRRKLRRSDLLSFFEGLEPSLVGIEACATAHHWARSIMALGHQVKLMPPAYVKPYVKRQKNDATDAAAICEAVSRPSMRFVPVKEVDQQGILVLHRTRDLLLRQRTMLINALRAHLAEFGIIMRQGRAGITALVASVEEGKAENLPELARTALMSLIAQLRDAHERANEIEREILAWHRNDELSRRLETISGVGVPRISWTR
jgi:transposase